MPLLPAQDNFADLREVTNALIPAAKDETLKRLLGVVGTLLYRSQIGASLPRAQSSQNRWSWKSKVRTWPSKSSSPTVPSNIPSGTWTSLVAK